MRALMLFLLWVCAFNTAHAEEFSAKVIAVLDGDTVLIRRSNSLVKIRLAEIDAPEKSQIFGETSRRSLSGMVLGKQVKVNSRATDQYGRMIAHLSVNGLDVNAEQIRRGMAWAAARWRQSRQSLRDPLHSNQALVALQEEARRVPRGLWAQRTPVPPWDWRKQHPSIMPAQPHAAALPAGTRTTAISFDHSCGNKKRCSEMSSCAEARHYFTACGIQTLDGDRDGVPCVKLCGAQKK